MERRKQTDLWAKLLFFLNILSWILIALILLVFHRAQPEFETLFDRFYRLNLRTNWDIQYLYYLVYMVSTGIFISVSGLLLSRFRGRRKKDHKKVLMFMGGLSVLFLWLCLRWIR